ncbi:peptidylprolyl isomerase [Dysgonomonas sp. 216]|uniref:FKBP-type peptidyl-prolyl cis-trans isomerase n=1 Tax=Dysgonomonas sp. 216 TaxID=2302934 RepID=UPI0013D65F1C|nr:FKBP-type peptidyl-prolyl cis-trans isomerase [Dysgonomonas sp. 216]NDW17832.1 peptidylprolyl isomerase [Dysgonomonas sp. 216]
MKIEANKFVSLTYDLNVGEGDELELMERATAENPLEFIYGTNSMIEAFEAALANHAEGDSFKFTLTPDQAYGEFEDEKIVDLPKDIFVVDGQVDDKILFVGNTIPMMDSEGHRLNGSVVEVGDNTVKMDFNHPLAGETLHFAGKILTVRDASAEEIAALFAPHGGCGCGDCDCDDPSQQADSCGCGSGCGCN